MNEITLTFKTINGCGFEKNDIINLSNTFHLHGSYLITDVINHTTLTVLNYDWYGKIYLKCVQLTKWICKFIGDDK